MQKETEMGQMVKAVEKGVASIPKDSGSDTRTDFERLSDELINGSKHDEPITKEENVEPKQG